MSKPRSDSVLKNLPEDRQETIIAWCRAQKSDTCPGGYVHAQQQLALDGIVISQRALSEFYSWYRLKDIFSRVDQKTTDFEEMLRKKFPEMDPKRVQEFGQTFFTMEATAAGNAEEFREMEKLRLAKETAATKGRHEGKKLELAERRVKLLEENQSKAKEKLESLLKSPANKGGLTKETLQQIEEAAKLL